MLFKREDHRASKRILKGRYNAAKAPLTKPHRSRKNANTHVSLECEDGCVEAFSFQKLLSLRVYQPRWKRYKAKNQKTKKPKSSNMMIFPNLKYSRARTLDCLLMDVYQ